MKGGVKCQGLGLSMSLSRELTWEKSFDPDFFILSVNLLFSAELFLFIMLTNSTSMSVQQQAASLAL